jgi:hypothetical protein
MSEESLDKASEIYELIPCLEAFPFNEYQITLEDEGLSSKEIGISPLLISALGEFGKEKRINFYYLEEETTIMISIDIDDINYLIDISASIKKLNSVNQGINNGITSDSIEVKIDEIKQSRKFIKQLKSDHLNVPPFEMVLSDLIEINGTAFTSDQMIGLQRLIANKIKRNELSANELYVAKSYLNFQLNYAKILLGIIISAKIY